MVVYGLMDELTEAGIALKAVGEQLEVDAPKGALTDELRDAIRQYKAELLALLRQAEVSPGPGEPLAARTHSCEPGKATGERQPTPCPTCGSLEWVPHGQYDKVCAYLASKQKGSA